MKHKTKLAAKVAAYNRCHAEANRLQPLFAEALRPFIGKKVRTQTGLTMLVERALLGLEVAPGFHIWRGCDTYTLHWSVRCWEGVEGSHDQTAQATFYVGNMVSNTHDLESLIPYQPLPTDYTVESVQAARARLKKAKEELSAANSWSALGPFGEYDQ